MIPYMVRPLCRDEELVEGNVDVPIGLDEDMDVDQLVEVPINGEVGDLPRDRFQIVHDALHTAEVVGCTPIAIIGRAYQVGGHRA